MGELLVVQNPHTQLWHVVEKPDLPDGAHFAFDAADFPPPFTRREDAEAHRDKLEAETGATNVGLEWVSDNAVTIWREGKPINTGHGPGRAEALHDLWTTLVDTNESRLAAWIARKYRVLTGSDPRR